MERTCLFCNSTFSTNRANAKYCSSAHRLYAHRQKHGIVTKKEKEHTHCQREGCDNEIPESRPSDALYCSNACKQSVYNTKHSIKLSIKRAEERERRRKAKERAEKARKTREENNKSKSLADQWLEGVLEDE